MAITVMDSKPGGKRERFGRDQIQEHAKGAEGRQGRGCFLPLERKGERSRHRHVLGVSKVHGA